MNNRIITDELITRVLRALEGESSLKGAHISYEVQDDFQHLLISIAMNDVPRVDGASCYKRIGELVNSLVPERQGEYSWMVNFKRNGKIIDSRFGGDRNSPNSGL